MKDKSPLSLMESGLMILVFALTAALCLQAFTRADLLSRESVRRDEALLLAQSAGETLKHCHGDYAQTAHLLSGSWNGETLRAEENGLTLLITPEAADLSTLGKASIRVVTAEGKELAVLPIAWQEVPDHG